MEEVVKFKNGDGETLIGIIHIPDRCHSGKKKIGVNILNPGIKSRVAPHRLNVKIARRLCKAGFFVFRFDPSGIGDSGGEISSGKKVDVWGKIQRGLFVEDTKIANEYFVSNYDIEEIILIGNCGGAITAIISGAEEHRVSKLILIDVPIILMGSDYSFADTIINNNELVDKYYWLYIKKIFQISSWLNLIFGKTDFKALKKILKLKLYGIFSALNKKQIEDGSRSTKQLQQLNDGFFKAFKLAMGNKKKILFITAGKDSGVEAFRTYFEEKYLHTGSLFLKNVQTFTIENANHAYTLCEWQDQLINKIADYTNSSFGIDNNM